MQVTIYVMRNIYRALPAALLLIAACASTSPAAAPVVQPVAEAPAATRPMMTPGTVPIPARGLSCRAAIPLAVTTEAEGIAKEDAWIADNYPGATKAARTQTACNGKTVDQLDLDTANGRRVTLFFENSGWTATPK
jgi:hypothetical protein